MQADSIAVQAVLDILLRREKASVPVLATLTGRSQENVRSALNILQAENKVKALQSGYQVTKKTTKE